MPDNGAQVLVDDFTKDATGVFQTGRHLRWPVFQEVLAVL